MFAIFMGMSNLGNDTSRYMGTGLLRYYGGVTAPEFDRLPEYVMCRSLARLLPLFLVPCLVPNGGPADTAESMGAGIGVTGEVETTSPTGNAGATAGGSECASDTGASKRDAVSILL